MAKIIKNPRKKNEVPFPTPKDAQGKLFAMQNEDGVETGDIGMVVQIESGKFCIISLSDGNRWENPTEDEVGFYYNVSRILPEGTRITLEQE